MDDDSFAVIWQRTYAIYPATDTQRAWQCISCGLTWPSDGEPLPEHCSRGTLDTEFVFVRDRSA